MSKAFAVTNEARALTVAGVVQGVGFRPFVARLAARYGLTGWVLNDAAGVRIHIEGPADAIALFIGAVSSEAPHAAVIAALTVSAVPLEAHASFTIRHSDGLGARSVPIGVDLPVCGDCLREMRDPADRRFGYPYINCTNCGPRYSVILGLPYDRPNTTLRGWQLCAACRREYEDPADRRYHAQPIACGRCGPHLSLELSAGITGGDAATQADHAVITRTAALLRNGAIVAVKGLGGYHLACDARNDAAVSALRERKFRKDKPFAVMVRDLTEAHAIGALCAADVALLTASARPIVLTSARAEWALVAPDQSRIGLLLPYAPLHELLFDAGAPPALVMTSGNRSSEPIAFRDADARARLTAICDAVLVGERPIARRADDSVVAAGVLGPTVLRRARGLAPGVVARLPTTGPILAVGADLKNTVTLVVDGQAIVSPHIGDLEQRDCFDSFREAVEDLLAIYGLHAADIRIAHDLHPAYHSTRYAEQLGADRIAVQHHHAHIASVLAEHALPDESVLGLALDGTGYGSDGTIWGCEFLAGSLRAPFARVAHLPAYTLFGGDSAARFPALCAIGLTDGIVEVAFDREPFLFPSEALLGRELLAKGLRTHVTTSAGRLFDAVAALCGFTARVSFEGQAAMWLEHEAEQSSSGRAYRAFDGKSLDVRDMLAAIVTDRIAGVDTRTIARAFHLGFARALSDCAHVLAREQGVTTIVLSGGVWQNRLLLDCVVDNLRTFGYTILTNRNVPVNDGGISLGQAAMAAFAPPSQMRAL